MVEKTSLVIVGVIVASVFVLIIYASIIGVDYPSIVGVEKLGVLKPFYKEVPKKATAVIAGYGWSTKDNEVHALEEAVSKVKEGLGKDPEFVFLFSSVGYDEEKLLQEIRKLLPETKIYGGTSSLGVMSKDGFHVGEKASIAILGVSSERIEFGVGGADLDEFPPREAGKRAIQAAIENAGKEKTWEPNMVFITSAPGKEEGTLEGIMDVLGPDVPIFGGSSGDDDLSGKWKQFVNDKVYSNGVALAVMYTDLKVGFAYEAGYETTEKRGIVTRAEGRTIYEINYRPAAEVYNEWSGGIISEELEQGGRVWSTIMKTTYNPIARILHSPTGEVFYLSIHPLSVDAADKSLTVFADVEVGDEILSMRGDWEVLLNRFQTTPNLALVSNRILTGDGYFALYTFCAGSMLAIPEGERPKMPFLVKSSIGDVPFIGTFTLGEQGFVSEIGNHHGNLVSSIVVVAPWL